MKSNILNTKYPELKSFNSDNNTFTKNDWSANRERQRSQFSYNSTFRSGEERQREEGEDEEQDVSMDQIVNWLQRDFELATAEVFSRVNECLSSFQEQFEKKH